MNFPTIDRSFFAGECFDAYRVLGAHPSLKPGDFP